MLRAAADPTRARALARYFQAVPGGYGWPDRFLGATVPAVRRVARAARAVALVDVGDALESPWHEERLCALLVLVDRFERCPADRARIHRLYLRKRGRINNWDLVDLSAPTLVGAYLDGRLPAGVDRLIRSRRVWDRRIGVLATFHGIRNGDVVPALAIAERLLDDPHDLIHKAAGWMLREVGRRDRRALEGFLRAHAARMPRTMLRYAIEHLSDADRRRHMARGRRVRRPATRTTRTRR